MIHSLLFLRDRGGNHYRLACLAVSLFFFTFHMMKLHDEAMWFVILVPWRSSSPASAREKKWWNLLDWSSCSPCSWRRSKNWMPKGCLFEEILEETWTNWLDHLWMIQLWKNGDTITNNREAWIIDINHSSSTQLLQVKGQRAFAAELQCKELENSATAGFHGS